VPGGLHSSVAGVEASGVAALLVSARPEGLDHGSNSGGRFWAGAAAGLGERYR
jgi:hypothetical protein